MVIVGSFLFGFFSQLGKEFMGIMISRYVMSHAKEDFARMKELFKNSSEREDK